MILLFVLHSRKSLHESQKKNETTLQNLPRAVLEDTNKDKDEMRRKGKIDITAAFVLSNI